MSDRVYFPAAVLFRQPAVTLGIGAVPGSGDAEGHGTVWNSCAGNSLCVRATGKGMGAGALGTRAGKLPWEACSAAACT